MLIGELITILEGMQNDFAEVEFSTPTDEGGGYFLCDEITDTFVDDEGKLNITIK